MYKLVVWCSSLALLFALIVGTAASCTKLPFCSDCNVESKRLICEIPSQHSIQDIWHLLPTDVQDLTILAKLNSALFSKIPLHDLNRLNLSHSIIREIGTPFCDAPGLRTLLLAHMGLSAIDANAFRCLPALEWLDLSGNELESLPVALVSGLPKLNYLNLANSRLKLLPADSFASLPAIQYLDLSRNSLFFIRTNEFSGAPGLQKLNISSNLIQDLHPATVSSAQLQAVDLGNNHLFCSCGLIWLRDALTNSSEKWKYSRMEMITCRLGVRQWSQVEPVYSLNISDFVCQTPQISAFSPDHEVAMRTSTRLNCSATGLPDPKIVWKTPHNIYLTNTRGVLWTDEQQLQPKVVYSQKSQPLYFRTTIVVDENGDLVITGFRGNMHGEYTCIAFNPGGNSSTTIKLTATSCVRSTMLVSLWYGTGGVVFMLLLAPIVFCLRHVMNCFKRHIRHSACLLSMCSCCFSSTTQLDEDGPHVIVRIRSPSKRRARDSSSPQELGGTSQMRETLEDMKARVVGNLERSIEKMRNDLTLVKNSGSRYLNSLKETGSNAAQRVRGNLAHGLESLKYHTQTIRELCGTGDIAHTISIATNLDAEGRISTVVELEPLPLAVHNSQEVPSKRRKTRRKLPDVGSLVEALESDQEPSSAGSSSVVVPLDMNPLLCQPTTSAAPSSPVNKAQQTSPQFKRKSTSASDECSEPVQFSASVHRSPGRVSHVPTDQLPLLVSSSTADSFLLTNQQSTEELDSSTHYESSPERVILTDALRGSDTGADTTDTGSVDVFFTCNTDPPENSDDDSYCSH